MRKITNLNPLALAILRFDSLAGLLVGVLVLVFQDLLVRLYGIPPGLVLFTGLANLAYGSYSGTLVLRELAGKPPSRRAIVLLVAGNLAWTGVCALLIALYWREASAIGIGVLVAEGIFVGALGLVERRFVLPFAR